ncbi:hypothetical protein DMA11_08160 [Marinilabiliaceae bacterium JC017]|nr:hypothetical protein DMA11_08160 [Marinilabiliaceae bacterium JC017]
MMLLSVLKFGVIKWSIFLVNDSDSFFCIVIYYLGLMKMEFQCFGVVNKRKFVVTGFICRCTIYSKMTCFHYKGEVFELKEDSGFVVLSFSGMVDGNIVLVYKSDDLAFGAGIGRNSGYSIQAKTNKAGEEYLYFSGFELKRIR